MLVILLLTVLSEYLFSIACYSAIFISKTIRNNTMACLWSDRSVPLWSL